CVGAPSLSPLRRSCVRTAPLVANVTVGTVGPELSPKGDGNVIVRVAVRRSLLPTGTPPATPAVTVSVKGLNVGVTRTFEGTSSDTSSLEFVFVSCGARPTQAVLVSGGLD